VAGYLTVHIPLLGNTVMTENQGLRCLVATMRAEGNICSSFLGHSLSSFLLDLTKKSAGAQRSAGLIL
jgi:hypothetical protein